MRAFVALDLPEPIRAGLARMQGEFRAAAGRPDSNDLRWARPEGIHLTLKFLGEISGEQVKSVTAALGRIGAFRPFEVEVKGLGFFPDARRPRVFWAGVEAGETLAELAERVERALEAAGFAPETRPFHPHLTLVRIKTPRPQPGLEALARRYGEASWGRFAVSEFFLFESRLGPSGATYRKVARFPESPPAGG